jgi:hydrogenase expression/formation protein HypC
MCLGVPGKVIEWIDQDPIFGRAIIEFGSVRRECQMACTPDAKVGQYVIVHAGIAIAIIDAQEAERTLQDLSDIANEFSSHNDTDGSAAKEISQ